MLCLYILPAIATILKIRKRKISQSAVADSVALQATSSSINDLTASVLAKFNGKLASTALNFQNSNLKFKLHSISLKVECVRELSFNFLNQTQLSTLLYV
jgi:hypothetical protein